MSCVKSRTPFLMERPFLMFRREPSTLSLWEAFFLTWSIWDDQVSRLSRDLPRERAVSTHTIGSLNSRTGRGFWIHLQVKRVAALFETLMQSSIFSANALSRRRMHPGLWQADLACGTLLWRPCRTRRELARRGGKGLTFHLHTDWREQRKFIPLAARQPACHG